MDEGKSVSPVTRRLLIEKLARVAAAMSGGDELLPCLAVTMNDRLDYFGQTVNIAARVQGLAEANEIVVTDDILSLPSAIEMVTDLRIETSDAQLNGVAGGFRMHRVRVT